MFISDQLNYQFQDQDTPFLEQAKKKLEGVVVKQAELKKELNETKLLANISYLTLVKKHQKLKKIINSRYFLLDKTPKELFDKKEELKIQKSQLKIKSKLAIINKIIEIV
jgi:hypothetical protein